MNVTRVRVGDVLALDRIPVEQDPNTEFTTIGIRSFGKGVFTYDPKPGSELGKLRFFEVRPNRLLVSNIKSWEGAVAVSPPEETGWIASNRFLIYRPIDHQIDPSWARWFFLSDRGLPLIQQASPGSADRNRTLAIERFEKLEIPLPPIEEQRSTALWLDDQRDVIDRQLGLRLRLTNERRLMLADALLATDLADLRNMCSKTIPLGDIGKWSSGGTPSAKESLYYDGGIPWAVIGDLNDGILTTTQRTITTLGLANSSARVIPPGSVLVAMYGSIGKLGLSGVEMATNQAIACCQPTVVTAEYLLAVFRCMRLELGELGQGGAQQNISQTILKDVRIPLPPQDAQARFVSSVSGVLTVDTELKRLLELRKALASAVVPASLNEAVTSLS